MNNIFLDLTPYYNHRMIYPQSTVINEKNEIGIDNLFFFEENFEFNKIQKNKDTEFIFRRNKNQNDNIICGMQEIIVPSVICNQIAIAGFCSFGNYQEYFELEFADGTLSEAKAFYSDLCSPLNTVFNIIQPYYENQYYNDGSQIFLISKVWHRHLNRIADAYIYYYTTKITYPESTLTKIIFPDNIFMNIFAITLREV